MVISIATANLYHMPFENVLSVIRRAGYEYVELDGYWKGGGWEIAQHIKGIPPRDVIAMVLDSGLRLASYHDLGGIIGEGQATLVAPQTYEYLALYDFPSVVIHTPHCKTDDSNWWESFRPSVADELRELGKYSTVCIENMTHFEGYTVPLLSPEELLQFAEETGSYVNFDTTHCAQEGGDITHAAAMMKRRIRSLHLSDFGERGAHLFPGEGRLDFRGFFQELDRDNLHAVTVECNSVGGSADEAWLAERYAGAREYVLTLIGS